MSNVIQQPKRYFNFVVLFADSNDSLNKTNHTSGEDVTTEPENDILFLVLIALILYEVTWACGKMTSHQST